MRQVFSKRSHKRTLSALWPAKKKHGAKRKNRGQVFISHSHKDASLAHWLAEKLREMGRKVWIDHDVIKPGKNLTICINGAFKECTEFLLLWSKFAKKSTWIEDEWSTAFINRKRIKIITCRLDKTQLPDLLKSYLHIDFRDHKKGYYELIESLN